MEVLIVTVLVLVLIALAVTILVRKEASSRQTCQQQLKQVGLAFKVFGNDGDAFPATTRGSLGYKNETDAWLHFQAMSNELGTARLLLCPQDAMRLTNRADNFNMGITTNSHSLAHKGNLAVSYFVGVDADETEPNMLLSGDRNLVSAMSGPMLSLLSGVPFAWTASQHTNSGYVALADGSVLWFDHRRLMGQLSYGPGRFTNRLLMPLVP